VNIRFWDRLKFLFDPDYLMDEIYARNRNLIEQLNLERRKVETEKKYTWATVHKMRQQLVEREKEILKLTWRLASLENGDENAGELLKRVTESVISQNGIDSTLALNQDSGRGGRSESLPL
jgi:hypothetical protein